MSSWESFSTEIGYHVRDGEKILFWLDSWVGDRPLTVEFSLLHAYAIDCQVKVSSYLTRIGDRLQWGPCLGGT